MTDSLLGNDKEATKETPADKVDAPAGGTPDAKDTPGDKGAEQGANKQEKEVPYEIKAPEGVEFEAEQLTEFTKFAKDELKLPLDQAQKLAEWYGKTVQTKHQTIENAWKETNEGWVKSAKEDKEIGGDNFEKSIGAAKVAINKFGNPEFIKALNITGFGNHPEAVRFFAKVAKAIGEDNLEPGQPKGDGKQQSAAEILFPTK